MSLYPKVMFESFGKFGASCNPFTSRKNRENANKVAQEFVFEYPRPMVNDMSFFSIEHHSLTRRHPLSIHP